MDIFLTAIIALFILIVVLFIRGWVKIPIGHAGIVLHLGKRSDDVRGEGWTWIVPIKFINDIIILDVRERTVTIRPEDMFSADRVHIRFNATVQVRVADLKAYLSLDPNVVEQGSGITSLIQSTIRQEVKNQSAHALLFGGQLNRGVENLQEILLLGLSPVTSRWGLEVFNLFLSDVDIDDPEMRRMLQYEMMKDMEARGEVAKARGDISKVNLLWGAASDFKKMLKAQFDIDIPPERAYQFLSSTYRDIRVLDIAQITANHINLAGLFMQQAGYGIPGLGAGPLPTGSSAVGTLQPAARLAPAANTAFYCSFCGRPGAVDGRFCENCGHPI
jgi:regulator of protease activity HflC (stomatin/prohibitin superfamily)